MTPRRQRILFLLKHRDYRYDCDPPYTHSHLCSGLLNSARLVSEMLGQEGYDVRLEQIRDNNCIDREVHRFRPDICVIEAYWVVPEKFAVLHKLHPGVTWVVRNHSALPFASLEGVVMDWSLRYMNYPNVILACNDARTDAEFAFLIALSKNWTVEETRRRCVLLPNYYPPVLISHRRREHEYINVGCFGAIRPLKNHLTQAVAALEFGESLGRPIHFHINATRIEQMAHPILKNLRALFDQVGNGHKLVEHPWMKREEFLGIAKRMNIALSVSFSETFSVVAADLATRGVPVVSSEEVHWIDCSFQASPESSADITRKMLRAWGKPACAVRRNLRGLKRFVTASRERWLYFLDKQART